MKRCLITSPSAGQQISPTIIQESEALFDVTPSQAGQVSLTIIRENETLFDATADITASLTGLSETETLIDIGTILDKQVTLIIENEALFDISRDIHVPLGTITELETLGDMITETVIPYIVAKLSSMNIDLKIKSVSVTDSDGPDIDLRIH